MRRQASVERRDTHASVREVGRARPSGPGISRSDGSARRRPDPWKTLAWVGAAAVVLVALGFAALLGVRSLSAPTTATSSREAAVSTPESASDQSLGGSATGDSRAAAPKSPGAATTAPWGAAVLEPDFITVNDIAYRSLGATSTTQSDLAVAGTTTTSLDTGGAPQTYTVYATPGQGEWQISSGAGTLVFEIVSRRLDGRSYLLTSNAIEQFGTWPSLPSGVHGSDHGRRRTHVRRRLGKDDLGVQVYTRPGIRIEEGFAVAPGTARTDPARSRTPTGRGGRPPRAD